MWVKGCAVAVVARPTGHIAVCLFADNARGLHGALGARMGMLLVKSCLPVLACGAASHGAPPPAHALAASRLAWRIVATTCRSLVVGPVSTQVTKILLSLPPSFATSTP